MIEIHMGSPITLQHPTSGSRIKVTTFEQALYLLERKWPNNDFNRANAVSVISSALDCIGSIIGARHAFITAARTAGYNDEQDLRILPPAAPAAFARSAD
ncbi:hypothetical protein KVU_1018 [Ketogulonicigenium vulgare WSH-001]|uniref:DUF982 domain-containing protein n=2 Tax=Ketogulonicigenium vulgare TaxID=92945 RepID=F9Y632_KETVW|nr:hypothetical protein KVU_1018 [Ketogulonicigenium vulgare WSH-001]